MKIQKAGKDYMKKRKLLLDEVYRDDPYYRDSVTPLIRMVLSPTGCSAVGAEQIPVVVAGSGDKPLVVAVFIIARKMPDTLQVSFFEALPDQQEAVDMLLRSACELAVEKNIRRIVIGLDGHVNNGLGFLAGPYDLPASFGSPYNPPYYIDYFEKYATSREILKSYFYDLRVSNFAREERVIKRISRRFKVRTGDFSDLRREIGVYTHLNNECFKDHPLYFERSVEEDYELFKSFGPFLKEENFLVSELAGRPIGFLLWYPDFHELVKPGRMLWLGTALKYRLPGWPISRFKIVEMGVLPECHGSAAIIGLISTCIEIARKKGYSFCESGWIFDSNTKSKGVARRWAKQPYKTYKFFEIVLQPPAFIPCPRGGPLPGGRPVKMSPGRAAYRTFEKV